MKQNFRNMDPIKRSQIASLGGKASHELGKAHQYTSDEARKAALKSWEVRRAKKAGEYKWPDVPGN